VLVHRGVDLRDRDLRILLFDLDEFPLTAFSTLTWRCLALKILRSSPAALRRAIGANLAHAVLTSEIRRRQTAVS